MPAITPTEKTMHDAAAEEKHLEHVTSAQDPDDLKMPAMDKVDEFGAHAKTDPREIALVKKLDRYIIVSVSIIPQHLLTFQPMLWLMYLFNFLDRNALINARLNNLEEDLGLERTQYNTCVSILFVGYM